MKLANLLADKIAASTGCDRERRAVIAYGLGAAIQMLELLLIALIFGLIFDCVIETLIIFWCVGLLRRSTGGEHCGSYLACVITSSLSICLLGWLCRHVMPSPEPWICAVAGILPAFGAFAVIAWKYVPKGHTNKPITDPRKIARLRRQCLVTALIYLAAAILLICFRTPDNRTVSAFWALIAAVWWQGIMITDWAGHVTHAMDRILNGKS